jgi:TRAP-type C4-dicarboxylate transport system permease small subunit
LISNYRPDLFAATLERIGRFERAVTFGGFIVLIVVVFADVVSREIAGTGLHWARQVGVYANLFVIMFGIGLASSAGTHLRPRFADNWLPASWSGVLDRLQDGLMAIFCLGFAVVAVGMVYEGFELAERSAVLGIVIWPFQAVIPLVFGLATFRHGVYALYPALRPAPDVAEIATQIDSKREPR